MVSDMSAIHGIRDVTEMDGRSFVALAWRLPAYQGVMRARVMSAADDGDTGPPQAAQAAVPATRAVVQADPVLAGMFSFG